MELLRSPAHGLSCLFWEPAWIPAGHLSKHRNLAIALDKLHWKFEVQQTRERFTRHWARHYIAPDHYMVYFRLIHLSEYRLECREVPVNVIDGSDPHLQTLPYDRGLSLLLFRNLDVLADH
jgi:hypothetical protein